MLAFVLGFVLDIFLIAIENFSAKATLVKKGVTWFTLSEKSSSCQETFDGRTVVVWQREQQVAGYTEFAARKQIEMGSGAQPVSFFSTLSASAYPNPCDNATHNQDRSPAVKPLWKPS